MPTALITGITGQDGSYLAEFLLDKGYKVVREKFACGKRFAQEVLTAAYEDLGLAPAHGITDAMVEMNGAVRPSCPLGRAGLEDRPAYLDDFMQISTTSCLKRVAPPDTVKH